MQSQRGRPLGTYEKHNCYYRLGVQNPLKKPLPGARNRPLGPRNEVPEPSRTIPGLATIRQNNKNESKRQARWGEDFGIAHGEQRARLVPKLNLTPPRAAVTSHFVRTGF